MTRAAVAALVLVLAAGCASSRERRIRRHPDFHAWPPDVREAVRDGRVEPGFTPEMVLLSVGEPDMRSRRVEADGEAEVWSYVAKRAGPGLDFGVGVGVATGGSSRVGGGVSVGTGTGIESAETLRVVFRGGKVAAVETPR